MVKKEIEYAEKFKRTCDVPISECYIGGKWCASCMYCADDTRWNTAGFEHQYCTRARKDDSGE